MDAAVAALIGAGLGAVIPALTTAYTSRLDQRRSAEDRQDARDARLFAHRRQAYEAFVAEAVRLRDFLFEYHLGLLNVPEPDYDFADSLVRLEGAVRLHGTAAIAPLARQVILNLSKYSRGAEPDEVETALDTFFEQARRDLGVPDA